MDARLQFVARRLGDGGTLQGILNFSQDRLQDFRPLSGMRYCGTAGLTDSSRRPYRYAHQLPFQVENFILNVKREHGRWGARKIRERLGPTRAHAECAGYKLTPQPEIPAQRAASTPYQDKEVSQSMAGPPPKKAGYISPIQL